MEFTLDQIAALIDGKIEGEGNQRVSRLDKIQDGKPGGISFLANEKYEPFIYQTQATAVIVSNEFQAQKPIHCSLIRVKDPYNSFTKLLENYAQAQSDSLVGMEEGAFVHPSSSIGKGVFIGAFSYIGKNCKIGNNVKIHQQVYIGDDVHIGDDCHVHVGVKIFKNSIIGKHCTIHPGAIIGADGFGFAPQDDGSYKAIPQLGNVVLEDHVSIGSNTCIDCATMGSTLIKRGVKIDNLVQIAHNVVIGENTVIASQTGISGSTEIGKNCIIAGQVGIVGHIKIADNTTLGAKTGITRSINKTGQTIFGYMGYEIKEFLRSYSIFKKLPDLQERVKELEKKA